MELGGFTAVTTIFIAVGIYAGVGLSRFHSVTPLVGWLGRVHSYRRCSSGAKQGDAAQEGDAMGAMQLYNNFLE